MVKRRFTLKLLVLATALGSALALGATGYAAAAQAAPARSDPAEQCDLNYYCLNAWGGGPYEKSYNLGNGSIANNSFEMVGVDRCNNGDKSTKGCPGTGDPADLQVFQIEDTQNGKCVSNSPGNGNLAYQGTCNKTGYPGTGGSNGTLFLRKPAVSGQGDCYAIGAGYYINSYWTTQNGGWSDPVGLFWTPDANGSTIVLSGASPNCLFND